MNDLERIQELRAELDRHNYLYHTLGSPKITDAEFDGLYKELLSLEAAHPEAASPTSPTQRVGAAVTGFQKVRHGRRMLSLENAFTGQEVLDRLGTEHVVLEPKVDGLSLKLVYKSGELVQAVTRGNGMEGDDVTANARTITTIPLHLSEVVDLEVTGEVYMTYSRFNALNKELEERGEELMANPRNAAAGSLKSKEPAEVHARRLSFVAHGCFTQLAKVTTHLELLDFLERLRFQTTRLLPLNRRCSCVTTDLVLETAGALDTVIGLADQRRQALDLPTDGLVFKIDSLAKQREMGEGTKSPKWAVAYKFPPERKRTKLEAVTLQVGRTGRITPVAEVSAVSLSGTVVRRASLCNQDEIERLGIGIGDDVYIEKSAEIIPKIVGLAEKRRGGVFEMPSVCPCCGTALTRAKEAVDFYCPNGDCEDQVYGRLVHALGKQCLDVDGCGRVMVRLLMENGVRKLQDVFKVEILEGVKPTARRKFFEGREKAKMAPLWRKLHALGIDEIGAGTSQDIAARFPAFVTLFFDEGDHTADYDDLQRILGPVAYSSLLEYFDKHADDLIELDALGFRLREDALAMGPLSGKTFVITGTLMSGTRDMVIREIESAGGMVKGSVSAKVQFLIQGEDAGATKTRAAAKHGVTVISEEELYRMLGKEMPVPDIAVDEEEV